MRLNSLRPASWFIATVAVGLVARDGIGQDATPTFRAGTALVEVTATVTDRQGRFVSGLRREDFQIYDNGVLQPLSYFHAGDEPVSLGVLMDASGSMAGAKLRVALGAVSALFERHLRGDDEVFFVEFGYSARLTQDWTTDRTALRRAIRDVQNPTGDTALRDAIALALPTAAEGRHRKKALLLISDGRDSASLVGQDDVIRRIARSDVMVYALAVDGGGSSRRSRAPDVTALRRMTNGTGGRTEVVSDVARLDATLQRLAAELRGQYQLGFEPATQRDGRHHAIRVTVSRAGARVRAREGYVAE